MVEKLSRPKPVIAVAGLACETSTFSPARTTAADFHAKRGDEIIAHYDFLQQHHDIGDDAIWEGILIGHALPGGIVKLEAYESLAGEIVDRLTHLKTLRPQLDGLWFDIHGAMSVEDVDDAEADLLLRIRQVIGKDVVVSASMDLHGNVSRSLVKNCDLVTCYRTAPHVDTLETQQRACRNLITVIKRRHGLEDAGEECDDEQGRPLKAWIPVPVLLSGEKTSTRMEPARRIYAAVSELVASSDEILDAAVWVGYAWADEPRSHAAVVVTGWDRTAVGRGAEKLAHMFWEARAEFRFVAKTGSLMECLNEVFRSTPGPRDRPFFISDSGDNPTAGGSGDVTWTLKRVIQQFDFTARLYSNDPYPDPDPGPRGGPRYTVIYASLPGPEAVATAVEAGIGAEVTVTAGAEVDNVLEGPVTMTGRVDAIRHGDRDAGTEVVLRVRGTCIHVILTARRKPYHLAQDFAGLGLDPRTRDNAVVFVKIGYLEPELYEMARRWMLALTPGAVDQNLSRLGHFRIERPMWPLDRDGVEPDLRARFVPWSGSVVLGRRDGLGS